MPRHARDWLVHVAHKHVGVIETMADGEYWLTQRITDATLCANTRRRLPGHFP
jgi:hypothetical protein